MNKQKFETLFSNLFLSLSPPGETRVYARNNFSKTCQSWKRATSRFLSQRNSSSNSWTDRIFYQAPDNERRAERVFFLRNTHSIFPLSGFYSNRNVIRAFLLSLSPFPDNYNRRRLAFRRCHPSPCSLQRNKTRKEEKEGIRKGREIRSVTDNVTVPLSLFPYETTMRLPAVAGFTAEPRVPGVPTVPHDSFLVRNVCARTYIEGEGYETARTKRLMRRYRKKIKTVVWLDKRLIFNGANLEESRWILGNSKLKIISVYPCVSRTRKMQLKKKMVNFLIKFDR